MLPKPSLLLSVVFIILLSACQYRGDSLTIKYPEGGYKYPIKINNRDSEFCLYPLKDMLEPNDSFLIAYYGHYLLKSFDEKNLSLKPEGHTVFRFISGGGIQQPIIILITENEITIKEGLRGMAEPWTDDEKLTEKERMDLNLLNFNFPLNKIKNNTSYFRKRYLDSLISAEPELLDPNYYKALKDKAKTFGEERFSYEIKKIQITNKTFIRLVDSINNSGYWQQSYRFPCNSYPSDANSYILEVNTREKYNVVRIDDCETNFSKIARAYQLLINTAGLENKIIISGIPQENK